MKQKLPVLLIALSLVAGLGYAQVGGVAGVSGVSSSATFTAPTLTGAISASGGVFTGATPLCMEGATADAFETCFAVTDPTADITFTLANASGAVFLSTLTTNAPDVVNSIWGASNALVLEGATADGFETSIAPADPTADVTFTLPNASGTAVISTLATNAPDAANAVTGASNAVVFEGVTADGFETSVAPQDPTADQTITLPNESGYVALSAEFQHNIADSGGAGAAVYNYEPTAGVSVATFDCSDADGCDLNVGEASAVPGQRLIIIQTAATAGTVTLKNNPGVINLDAAGDQALTVGGTVELVYIASTWVQIALFYDNS